MLQFCRVLMFVCVVVSTSIARAETAVPEPFRGHDENSNYVIDYSDLSAVLNTVVVDVGRSDRRAAETPAATTGTRMRVKINRTANEGNRFYFETFEDEEAGRQFLHDIQVSLEALPTLAPLKYFSRQEQLAYWLNLYNVTVLNQVIEIYPTNNLKRFVAGRNSKFSEKILTVADVPLSLDDIQFTILKENYDGNPLVIYGLYQGIIGGPSIRKSAYTGNNVYKALEDNAIEFINSNRGTYIHDEKTFRVSSYYDRSSGYFPAFDTDLSSHLLTFLEGEEKTALQETQKIKADIDDWTVTDLGGSHRSVGGSLADNRAAMLDSVKSTNPFHGEGASGLAPVMGGPVMGASVGAGSSYMASKSTQLSLARIDPGLLTVLADIDDKRREENLRKSVVEIEELENTESAQEESSEADDD